MWCNTDLSSYFSSYCQDNPIYIVKEHLLCRLVPSTHIIDLLHAVETSLSLCQDGVSVLAEIHAV